MKNLLLICTAVLLFSACERDNSFEGPNLENLYGDFSVLESFAVSANSVDFSANENLHFTARFSTITNWEITITGNSGAVEVISGRSSEIDASNSSWNGTTGSFPSFKAEPCSAVLMIESDSSSHQANFTIQGKKAAEGVVVADFENGIESGWNVFAQSGANMSFFTQDTGIVPHGSNYFDMGGEVNWDWLIGLIDFPAKAYDPSGFGLSSNADNVYFNVLIKKKEGLNNGILLFQFREDENNDGTFTEASEDMYSVEVKGQDLTEQWSIYSLKYSDLVALVNGNLADPNGNKLHNPELLFQVSCLFLANPASGYSQADMDLVIFTEGKPLKL